MSKKSEKVRGRLNTEVLMITRESLKSNGVFAQMGKRDGKILGEVTLEVFDELSVYPTVTAEEVELFCRQHIKRCNINLANAKDRGDKRAVAHLERKLTVYEYLYRLVREQSILPESITSCPNCRVHSVEENGVCACCGHKEG